MTGRAIAKTVDPPASQAGVAKVLDALVLDGLVLRNDAGPSAQFVLNREHLAAPLVEALAELRATLLDRLTAAAEAMQPAPLGAYLFGSAARGDGTAASDIDIALVVSDEMPGLDTWDDATAELRRHVHAMTGNDANLVEYSPRDLFGGDEHWLVRELRRDGIRLGGAGIDDLARRWQRLDARTRHAAERAGRLLAEGRYAEAVDAFQEALTAYRALGDRYGEAIALGDLGNAYSRLDRPDDAAEAFVQAATMLRAMGDRHHEAAALAGAGRNHAALAKHAEAIEAYERAMSVGADLMYDEWQGVLRVDLAESLHETGDNERALTECERGVRLLRGAAAVDAEAHALLRLADFLVLADAAAAVEAADRALLLFRGLADRRGEGAALQRLGSARALQRAHDESIALFGEALAIFREIGDHDLEADALWFLGVTVGHAGATHEGMRSLRAAAEIYRALGRPHDEARALNSLGRMAESADQQVVALDAYRRALDAYRPVGDETGTRSTSHDLERVYADRLRPAAS